MELNPMIDDMETPLHTQFENYKTTFSFALKQANFDKTVFFSIDPRYPDHLIFTCYDTSFLEYLREYEHIKYFILFIDPKSPYKLVVQIPDEIQNHKDVSLARKAKMDLVAYLKNEYDFEVKASPSQSSINLPYFI